MPVRIIIAVFLSFALMVSAYADKLRITPAEKVGISTQRLELLDRTMQDVVEKEQIAGCVMLVARHGKIVHYKAYGKMNLETGQPMPIDALFRIYSMTKPITSVAALTLYERGLFQLNYPVEIYLPVFKGVKVFAGFDDAVEMKLEDQKKK